MDGKSEILQGTLDLMVLKTLDAMGPLHGYGIALRIEQVGKNVLHYDPVPGRYDGCVPIDQVGRRNWTT